MKHISLDTSCILGPGVAKAIIDNKRLLNLELIYCSIAERSGECIKKALAKNKSLRLLNLEGNHLGNDDILAILEGIKINRVLKEINVSRN
jgi:hypothetical protein